VNLQQTILSFIFLSITFFSFSQENYNYKSMVVSDADLKGTTYKNDSTANAFYIYEKGVSRIENGKNYNLLTDYYRKIKILNKEGFKESKIEILLYRDKNRKEKIKNLIAYTYNLENGSILKTKLEKSEVYREKYNEHYTLVKFTFPNIKPGSVITYSYQLESPFIFNYNGWDFQDDIPKLYSEYVADLPGNYVYNIRLIGLLKLDFKETSIKKSCLEVGRGGVADCAHSQYIMKNIPAFREENFMTAKKNYFSRVAYELSEYKGFDGVNKKYTKTWKNVDKELKSEKTIGVQLKKINTTKNILPEAIKTMPIGLEKAKTIYRYVTNHYTWDKKYRIFRDVNLKETIDSNVGNVTENLIVRLSLDEKEYLLDATEKKIAFGQIPFRCLNQYGRLLDFKNGSSWIDIKAKNRSSYFYKEKLQLTDEGIFNGIANYLYEGYHASSRRKKLLKSTQENFLKNILNTDENLIISEAKLKNEDDFEKPFIEEINFTKQAEQIDDLIYLKPFAKPFFKENPFKLNERTYPVDFGFIDSYRYLVIIEIPENYEFLDIPKNINYGLPEKSGRLTAVFQLQGNQLLINHKITFSSPYYPPEYYDSLKEFFNLIINMENNTLITIKKNN